MFKQLVLISTVLIGTACQQSSPINTFVPAPRAQMQSASIARQSVSYTPEDYRVFLTGKLFEALDQDKNKGINSQEIARLKNKAAVAQFSQMDTNRNGSLELTEFQEAKNMFLLENYSFKTLSGKLSDFFKTKDLNKNGFVSQRESEDASMLNLIFDVDHDGRFNVTEFVNAVSSILSLSKDKTQTFLQRHLN